MKRKARIRALVVCIVLAFCFTGFSYRLVHLQVTMHEALLAKARANQSIREEIPFTRGNITDCHGQAMAGNEPVKSVILDATVVKAAPALAELLAPVLKIPQESILEKLTRETYSDSQKRNVRSPYIVLKKDVSESVADDLAAQLTARKMRGVSFRQDANRVYPNRSMASHIIGFVNSMGVGVDGIERALNSYLCGQTGFRNIERTRKGDEVVRYRGQEHEARNGNNVRLTIDMGLQNIVEQELDTVVKQFRPKGATVIMMNPKTGQILAMANRPTFDLNKQDGVKEASRLNLAIEAQVEPGSTFKIVTVAAVLNEKLVTPKTVFEVENGYWEWCKLKDHHPYSELTVNDILVHSSNIGVAKLATRLGDQRFFDYIHRFGFGEQTGIALPGEIKGTVHPPHAWSKISITRMPMGHEVTATPLQIATAISAIANGGNLMLPQIVQEITDEKGSLVEAFPPRVVRRVISPAVAAQVTDALVEVASKKGTAKLAQIDGFTVAGKTGTAQKLENGRYTNEKSVCSFVGFLPAEDPAFVLLVLIDEAQTTRREDVGGLVAAPVFSRIGGRAARYLGLTPHYETPAGSVVAKNATSGKPARRP